MQKGWAVAAISVVAALWLTEGPTQGQGQAYRAPRLPGTERAAFGRPLTAQTTTFKPTVPGRRWRSFRVQCWLLRRVPFQRA